MAFRKAAKIKNFRKYRIMRTHTNRIHTHTKKRARAQAESIHAHYDHNYRGTATDHRPAAAAPLKTAIII